MSNPRSFLKSKFLPMAFSISLFIALILLGEAACRLFTDINFLDNSAGLFSPNRFRDSYGNTPNFKGVSFGEAVSIDENGFRFYPGAPTSEAPAEKDLLILGDSVGFGPGIANDETIDEILRARLTDRRVYNASVIGYDTFDYKNAGFAIVRDKPEINEVLIVFCLNDISGVSAREIKAEGTESDAPTELPLVRQVNDYLRSRSKLYLFLKNLLRDTQSIYFQSDLSAYRKGQEYVDKAIEPLKDLATGLKANGISVKVFVSPYEVQLRPGAPSDHLLPQRMLAESFTKMGIEFVDLYPDFQRSGYDSKRLFLYGDPMHLSRKGNVLTADAICSHGLGC